MTRTVDLIKKHTQEYIEYMLKNGGYSFHRFTDGSIHCTKPMFVTRNIMKETGILPLRPVRELEELVKAAMDDGALVTINDHIRFRGCDVILGETEIAFCNSSVRIEYTGIYSLTVDCCHDLKAILKTIVKGHFGGIVYIEGYRVDIKYLDIMERGVSFPVADKKGIFITAYFSYESIDSIKDEEGCYIYGGRQNDSNHE